MALFASLIIRLFQLVFSGGTVFFSHNNCFGLFFQQSERAYMQNPWSVWFRFDPTVGLWVGVSSGARHDVKQTQAGSRGRKRDHSLATCAYVNKWGVNLSTCLLCTTCVIYDWLSTCVAWFSYVSDYGFILWNAALLIWKIELQEKETQRTSFQAYAR